MKRLAAFTLVILSGSSLPALSAATAEGASQLTSTLQTYLGNDPGVVTVTVDGDSYLARIDFAPHFAKIKDPKVAVSLSPLELKITGQGGGKWQVEQDQALSFAFKVENAIDLKGSANSIKGSGIFDEALSGFSSYSSDMDKFAFQQTVTGGAAVTEVTYTIESTHTESAASGTGDSADATYKSTFKNLRETVSTPSAPDGSMPPMQFTISAPDGTQDIAMKGLKSNGIFGLAAWLVAHPSPEEIIAAQAELKDKLRGAIPLWDNISGTSTINGLSINTMMGQFGIDRADISVDMNGVVADGKLREALTVTGLKLPGGIVPPFALNLVPQNFTIDFNVSDFDLAAPAQLIIDNFDLTQDPPLKPEMQPQLMAALMPKMAVTLGLGPSEIVASAYHLKAEGSMTAGPMSMPSGGASVQLKGIDEIMAAIQSAPPEMGMGQIAPVIIVAKGMAKQADDGFLSWQIESTPQGSVTVNGTDISKLGGGQ